MFYQGNSSFKDRSATEIQLRLKPVPFQLEGREDEKIGLMAFITDSDLKLLVTLII
jgi:hypothetical protein